MDSPSTSIIGLQAFCGLLDYQIKILLWQMMSKQLSAFDGFKEELSPLLSVVFDYLSANIIDSNGRSPAMRLLGLTWEKRKGFSGVLYTVALVSSLIVKRIYRSSLSWRGDESAWKQWLSKALKVLMIGAKALSLVSTVIFLFRGDYISLLHRIGGLRMIKDPSVEISSLLRASHLHLEHRKLLWLAMIGLGSAAAVSIDWQELKFMIYFAAQRMMTLVRTLAGRWTRFRSGHHSAFTTPINSPHHTRHRRNSAGEQEEEEEASRSTQVQCVACENNPAENPHRNAGCGHVFCLLCIHSLLPSSAKRQYNSSTSLRRSSSNNVSDTRGEDSDNDEDSNNGDGVQRCPRCREAIFRAVAWER